MTKDDKEIVSALRCALADKVGPERFGLWFGPSTRFEFDGRQLHIGVSDRFFLDWIRTNFRQDIEKACVETLGNCPALTFLVDNERFEPASSTEALGKSGEVGVSAAATLSVAMAQASRPTAGKVVGEAGDIAPRRRFASLSSFVEGQTNRLALASSQMVLRRLGQMNPLLLHGPTGVGKTHLLEGIWTAVRKSPQPVRPIYLSAEQFTTQFLDALRGSGLPSFRRKYRGVDLLILDDLQFLIGKRATQVELLYTIDTLMREHRQLVFTADRSPAELTDLAPELITRLQSGMVCRIEPPDYATRLGIVGQMASRMDMKVPEAVQQYVASRLTNHTRELSGALCLLQATSEALGRPISLPLAEESLSEMVRNSGRVVRLADIEKAVCQVFALEPASLQSSLKKEVSHPRMLAMWLARKHTRAALSEIGRYFGRRNHSTVISAQKRIDGWMVQGRRLNLAQGTWDIDEAIRQVESQLRVG